MKKIRETQGKKKEKKEKAKSGKKKQRTQKTIPEIVIPDSIKESFKREREEKQKKKKAQPTTTPGMFKVSEEILTRLGSFRSKEPIFFDPVMLSDPDPATAVRPKDPEHVKKVAEALWSTRVQPKTSPWMCFQFNVSHLQAFSYLPLLF